MTCTRLPTIVILVALAATTGAIKCWKCGSYSDGVGSITPCNNRTATRLETCPANAKYCIKYVSELTIVRDCVPTCNEKEWWGARTFCCETDECNNGPRTHAVAALVSIASLASIAFSATGVAR